MALNAKRYYKNMAENYIIVGDDAYIRDREIAKIKDKYLSAGEEELNYSVYKADEATGVMDSLGTIPFLADNRVILVKEAEELTDEFTETLLKYLESPTETNVLILSCDAAYKKKKSYKQLAKALTVIEAQKPDVNTVKGWIRKFFQKENIQIDAAAVELISELRGNDTIAVKSDLEKLAVYSGGDKITVSDVEQMVGKSVYETVFKLVDAINARNSEWTFNILGDLYDQKKQPQEIIGYLAWYLRIMQKIALLQGRGMGTSGITTNLGYKAGYARRLLEQSKKYPASRIKRWTEALFKTDRDIKTGRRSSGVAMEMLFVTFLSD